MMMGHNKWPPDKEEAEFFITYSFICEKAAMPGHTGGYTERKE